MGDCSELATYEFTEAHEDGAMGVVDRFAITIPCEPRAKGRPRVVKGHAYTPKRTREYETMIAWVLRLAWAERALMNGPLEVSLGFWLGTRRRVDADNLCKAVLDAAQGVVFEDDSQIVDLRVTRDVSRDCPRVEIVIERRPEQ